MPHFLCQIGMRVMERRGCCHFIDPVGHRTFFPKQCMVSSECCEEGGKQVGAHLGGLQIRESIRNQAKDSRACRSQWFFPG